MMKTMFPKSTTKQDNLTYKNSAWTGPRVLIALGPFLLALVLTGCTRISVVSDPPGAEVLWSRDGVSFQPWPPAGFWLNDETGVETPFATTGKLGDAVFITVQKDGYMRPLPRAAQLYAWRNEKLEFKLNEDPEAYARRMEAEGMVLWKGRWVIPEEYGLEIYDDVVMTTEDAERRRNLEQGLVEYNGEWLTPAERNERFAADMKAEGRILFKDRWVTQEVADAEQDLDDLVASIKEAKFDEDLEAPKMVGTVDHSEAQLKLANASGMTVQFIFSGAMTRSYTLEPYSSLGAEGMRRIIVPPGRYDIVIIPEDETAGQLDALYGSWPLAEGRLFSFSFAGAGDLREGLTEFNPPEIEVEDVPEIEIPEVEMPKQQNSPGGWQGGGGRGGRGGP